MRQTYEKEKVSLSVARLKTHGENFEVVIDPDNAIKFRKGDVNITEALKAEKVYSDAHKGDLASETLMNEIFKSSDPLVVAERIIKYGELQLNDEYRDNLRKEKEKELAGMILKDGVDANTGEPITATRLSNALGHGKLIIDLFRTAEDQFQEILEQLKTVLPISFEKKVLDIRIPSDYAAKLYGYVSNKTKIIDESWLSDGAWSCKAEISPGELSELMDELKSKTHGDVEITVQTKKNK